jgi:GNAT superfamily N-acetyltransferase
MWPRVPVGAMRIRTAEQNRQDMQGIVASGVPAGLLAYDGGEPVGWLALAPRAAFGRVEPTGEAVWLIACVYVAASSRGSGLLSRLLEVAVAQARSAGATSLEAIPRGWRPDGGAPAMSSLRRALLSAGFEAVEPRTHGVLFRRQL